MVHGFNLADEHGMSVADVNKAHILYVEDTPFARPSAFFCSRRTAVRSGLQGPAKATKLVRAVRATVASAQCEAINSFG